MCAYPTYNFQTRYPKHNYFLISHTYKSHSVLIGLNTVLKVKPCLLRLIHTI